MTLSPPPPAPPHATPAAPTPATPPQNHTPPPHCKCPLADEARAKAAELRRVVGVTIDPKGEHAIHALLHLRDDDTLLQKDAQQMCGTSKGSMQKFRKLLQQLHDQQSTPQQSPAEQQSMEHRPTDDQLTEAREKERLARRAMLERERYAAAKAVRETLESLVARIERQAARETNAQLSAL